MSDKTFNDAASAETRTQPERKPVPEAQDLLAKGITTKETLDWEARTPPPVLAPEPTPDDPAGWRNAVAEADRDHAERIEEKRQNFLARFDKAREDFTMARDYRGEPSGRER